MLYVIYGKDKDKAREKFLSLIDSLKKKRPNALIFRVDGEKFSRSQFEDLIFGQGLFQPKYIIAGSGILKNEDGEVMVRDLIKAIKETDHIVILFEETIEAKLLKVLEKNAEKVQEFDLKKVEKKPAFNIFAITDALGARDRKTLWVTYQDMLRRDVAPEELFWKLVWQVKTMLLVKTATSGTKLDLNPYVLQKNTRYAKNFSLEELLTLSRSFVELYHEARRGKKEFEIELERIILAV